MNFDKACIIARKFLFVYGEKVTKKNRTTKGEKEKKLRDTLDRISLFAMMSSLYLLRNA